MNEENPSTDATFDRLLDELHGIQSGQSYAAALEWTSRLRAGLDALESLAVRDAVLNAHLSKTEIASALGITRQTLYNRLDFLPTAEAGGFPCLAARVS